MNVTLAIPDELAARLGLARQLKVGRTSVYKYLDGIRPAVEQPAA